MNKYNCSIRLKYMDADDFGHNPAPLMDYNSRCCDDCNTMFVMPARLLQIKNKKLTIK